MSEGIKMSPEQVVKTVAELVERIGDLRAELHELLSRKYRVCRARSTRGRLFSAFTVHLNSAEYVKEVSVIWGGIVVANTRFSAVEFEPDRVRLMDRGGSTVRAYELCNLSTADVIELAMNAGKAIEVAKQELEPLIKRLEKLIEAVKTVVAALEMVDGKS